MVMLMFCQAIEFLTKLEKDLKNTPLEGNIVNLWLSEYPCIANCKQLEIMMETLRIFSDPYKS